MFYFRNVIAVYPHFGSKKVIKCSYRDRKLVMLNKGEVLVKVQRYKCSKCGKTFNTDLSDFVLANSNITLPVIDEILISYSIHGSSLYKI